MKRLFVYPFVLILWLILGTFGIDSTLLTIDNFQLPQPPVLIGGEIEHHKFSVSSYDATSILGGRRKLFLTATTLGEGGVTTWVVSGNVADEVFSFASPSGLASSYIDIGYDGNSTVQGMDGSLPIPGIDLTQEGQNTHFRLFGLVAAQDFHLTFYVLPSDGPDPEICSGTKRVEGLPEVPRVVEVPFSGCLEALSSPANLILRISPDDPENSGLNLSVSALQSVSIRADVGVGLVVLLRENSTMYLGQNFTFTVHLTNVGVDPVANVEVVVSFDSDEWTDTIECAGYSGLGKLQQCTGRLWKVYELIAAQSGFEMEFNVRVPSMQPARFQARAEIAKGGEADDENVANNLVTSVVIQPVAVDLELNISKEQISGHIQWFWVDIVVFNNPATANLAATNVQVTVSWLGLSFLSADPPRGEFNHSAAYSGVWHLGGIDLGEAPRLQVILYREPTAGVMRVHAEITGVSEPDLDNELPGEGDWVQSIEWSLCSDQVCFFPSETCASCSVDCCPGECGANPDTLCRGDL